jgi:hypothetical protein
MTLDKINIIALKWFEAFNEHNLEKLLSLYDDNAEHFSPKLKVRQPETNGLIKGKDALRAWWKVAFIRLPTLRYEIKRLTPYDDRVFMEYIRHVQGEDEMVVGEMLEVKNDLIIKSEVFHQ